MFLFLIETLRPKSWIRLNVGSNDSFTPIENNFRFFKIAKFEFKNYVKVHYCL